MANIVSKRDTVTIREAVHDIYKELTEGNDAVDVPFRTMKDVFMWAACLGYIRDERRPLAGKRVTIFRWAQFSPQRDVPLLKALAIATTGDIKVLLNHEEILSIAEEYANGGIHELRDKLVEGSGYPLWNLVKIITKKYP